MSDELSVMLRAAAHQEAVAAASEFPLTPAIVGRIRGEVRRRTYTRAALVATASAAALGVGVLGLLHLWPSTAQLPGVTPSTSPSVSPSVTPSAMPTASPSPSNEVSPVPTATPTAETTAPPPPEASVPAAVSGLTAGPGGGSGEISVRWTGTPDATGYRVYRSSAPGDPMRRSASFIISAGSTTVEFGGAYESIVIWSPSTNTFEYVEVVDGQPGYFVVAAFNAAGEGPLQGTVCAVPTGSSGSC